MSLFAGVVRAVRPGAGRRLALAAATILAACCAAQAQAPGQPQSQPQGQSPGQASVRKTFDDWQLRCETPAGAKAEQCALVQNVAAEDRPNLSLVVIVLKTADNRGYLLRVVAPLGVLLPNGLGLKIDQTDIGRASFVRCLTAGCVAEVVMDEGLIKSLRNGAQSTFIIFQTPEEGVGIPVSMKGFGPGFDALK